MYVHCICGGSHWLGCQVVWYVCTKGSTSLVWSNVVAPEAMLDFAQQRRGCVMS